MTSTLKTTLQRPTGKRRVTPASTGTPDPRPLTDYTVAYSTPSGHSRVTVTLAQPCIIRQPNWAFVDCNSGTKVFATSVTVVNNTTFYFDFPGLLGTSVNFIEPPYQDTQVQNFRGGFVVPGAKWFRVPVIN